MASVSTVERRSQPAYHQLPERGILVFESHHSSTFSMPPGQWPFNKIVWIPVGRGALEHDSSLLKLARDELLLIPTGVVHRFIDDHSAPLTLVMGFFSDAVVKESQPLSDIMHALQQQCSSSVPIVKLNSYRRGAVRDAFKAMLLEQTRDRLGTTAMLHVGLLELLVHLLRAEPASAAAGPSRDQSLDGTLEYVDDFFHKAIRVKDLADMCGISSRRYSDLFKLRTGKTVVQYINEKRIAYAQDRLCESAQIMYASVAAGFTDLTHFYRVFKKLTGLTPGQYLKQHQPPEA
jgi:AraC family L-rhamnose operon regulatory protein RhaS